MIDFTKLWRGPDFTSWLRAPVADKFLQGIDLQAKESLARLLGACSVSDDPKVRACVAELQTLQDLTRTLRNCRKENAGDDD